MADYSTKEQGKDMTTKIEVKRGSEPKDSLLCRVGIVNNSEDVVIKLLGYFYYDDGSRSYDPSNGVPKDVNIQHGEAGYLYSRNDTDCVQRIQVFILMQNSGSFFPETSTDTEHCISEWPIPIDPALSIKNVPEGEEIKKHVKKSEGITQ